MDCTRGALTSMCRAHHRAFNDTGIGLYDTGIGLYDTGVGLYDTGVGLYDMGRSL